jgi:outer membrane protein assembly factor BamA
MIRKLTAALSFSVSGFLLGSLFALNAFAASDISPSTSNQQPPELSAPRTIEPPRLLDTKFFPLVVYATEPTEGSTFGIMPVFLKIHHDDQRTISIYAPSITWNAVIHTTATFRWYYYPSENQSFTFSPSISTYTNYGLLLIWQNRPRENGDWTDDDTFRLSRNIFFRFFGLGPETQQGSQSSYTRLWSYLMLRRGRNIARNLNLGLRLEYRRDIVQNRTVPDLPPSTVTFAGTPGMGGGSEIGESVELRYDSRPSGEYSVNGVFARAAVGPYQGLAQSSNFAKFETDSRVLFDEASWVQGAARVYNQYVTSSQVPFYYQSSLGGEYILRGFIDDRFIDQGAWEADFEQRIRLFQTHIYGVTTDWRMDPFVTIGQVYGSDARVFQNPKVAGGVGFRAYIHPNVLGRVDVGDGGEGLNVYVEIGYPY